MNPGRTFAAALNTDDSRPFAVAHPRDNLSVSIPKETGDTNSGNYSHVTKIPRNLPMVNAPLVIAPAGGECPAGYTISLGGTALTAGGAVGFGNSRQDDKCINVSALKAAIASGNPDMLAVAIQGLADNGVIRPDSVAKLADNSARPCVAQSQSPLMRLASEETLNKYCGNSFNAAVVAPAAPVAVEQTAEIEALKKALLDAEEKTRRMEEKMVPVLNK